ncbi:hypothetical protein FQA39_LY09034 [Lamprigera yunnana]|nr:hypothetical protein FQA39_LY09034 [Lamprigera yunnana]
MRILRYFIGLTFVALLCYIFLGTTLNNLLHFKRNTEDDCKTAHIGILCINNTFNVINFYTMLKSICMYQIVPISLHIVADDHATNILNTLFNSLELRQVTINVYSVERLPHLQFIDKGSSELAKLAFPLLVERTVSKMLVIDPDLIFVGNINLLYSYDKITSENEILVLENEKLSSQLFLLNVERLLASSQYTSYFENLDKYAQPDFRMSSLNELVEHRFINKKLIRWFHVKDVRNDASFKSIYDTISTFDPNFFSQWNNCLEEKNEPTMDSIIVPEKCSIVPEAYGKLKKYPTLLFIREFYHESDPNDVTIVTQMSFDKFSVFELVCERWTGAISVAIYITEEEFPLATDYIERSKTLKNRRNIGYHVAFKKGIYQPINKLRNIALENVNTPYVLLSDIDLVPGKNLYNDVKQYISKTKDMNKKALVIPAFETRNDKIQPPIDVKEWLKMWDEKAIWPFKIREFKTGHGPTNYDKLRTANLSYLVKWDHFYEPYVVVKSTVIRYDNRFVGFAWNKVQQLMELYAADYDFIVLPNTFLTHKFHEKAQDTISFFKSENYRWCMAKLFNEFINYLNEKYHKSIKNVNLN